MVFKSFFNRNKVFLVPKNLICFYIIKQGFRFALPLKDKVKGKSWTDFNPPSPPEGGEGQNLSATAHLKEDAQECP